MSRFLVTAINSAKARFFTLEPAAHPEFESSPKLVEHHSIVCPEQELQGDELWANTKTGRNRGAGGQAHSYDDHRQNHLIEFERRFAQSIATQLLNLAQTHQAQQLVLVAEPQILGLLREAIVPVLPKHLKMVELARDLCHLKPHELHEYLADKGELPARSR
jgi:protein required for attachment to host cells